MSHQSGIKSSPELEQIFQKVRSSDQFRAFKVFIHDEQLKSTQQIRAVSTFESDYDDCVEACLVDKECCYVFVRMDTKSVDGHFEWVFLLFSPDRAPIRDKMLYASTKSTVKQLFGVHLIKDDLYGTAMPELMFVGFQKHMTAKEAPPPLTQSEQELMELKKAEVKEYGLNRKADTLPTISFPFHPNLLDALEKMKSNSLSYIQMAIEDGKEQLILTDSDTTFSLSSIVQKAVSDKPRYHFINFKHTHDKEETYSIVFFYTMPGYSCAVKERMLYSSCKGSLIDYFERNVKPIVKKMESADLSDVTQEMLYDEIYPPTPVAKAKFAKPRGPQRR